MTQPAPHARTRKTLGKIKTYLGGIYRQFLRNGDVEILFNGERVEYDEPQDSGALRATTTAEASRSPGARTLTSGWSRDAG